MVHQLKPDNGQSFTCSMLQQTRRKVTSTSTAPSYWKGFLHVAENKTELFRFLSLEISKLSEGTEGAIISAFDETVRCQQNDNVEFMSPTDHEEAGKERYNTCHDPHSWHWCFLTSDLTIRSSKPLTVMDWFRFRQATLLPAYSWYGAGYCEMKWPPDYFSLSQAVIKFSSMYQKQHHGRSGHFIPMWVKLLHCWVTFHQMRILKGLCFRTVALCCYTIEYQIIVLTLILAEGNYFVMVGRLTTSLQHTMLCISMLKELLISVAMCGEALFFQSWTYHPSTDADGMLIPLLIELFYLRS